MSDRTLQRLCGHHAVLEALRARRRPLRRLLVRKGRRRPELESIVEAALALGLPVVEVEAGELAEGQAGAGNPQGVVLEAGPLPELGLEALCGESRSPRWIVALDGVEDPRKVGAVVRAAEAAGAMGLLLTARRAPPLSPTVARASAGALEWLPVARVGNLRAALKTLKSKGFWVVGADPAASLSVFDAAPRILAGDLVLLLGAEGRGLRPSIESELDHRVHIPMPGRVASLNVATAAAVVLFELVRRTRAGAS